LERAVLGVIGRGIRTKDVGGDRTTMEFAREVASRIEGTA
jgi:isocitrate/isopropylmalate dehydrogenase